METVSPYVDIALIVAFVSSNAVVISAIYGLLITGITAYCIKDSVYYWKPLGSEKIKILYFFVIAPFFYGIILLFINIVLYCIFMLILYIFDKHANSLFKLLLLICSLIISVYISIKVFLSCYKFLKRKESDAP